MVFFGQISLTHSFLHSLATCMKNGNEPAPNINPAGRGQLVKMHITLEPHGIFDQILLIF